MHARRSSSHGAPFRERVRPASTEQEKVDSDRNRPYARRAVDEPENHIRGAAFLDFLRVTRRELGEDVYADVVARFDGAFGECFRAEALVPNGWYPIGWYRALHAAAAAAGCPDDHAYTCSRITVREDLSGGVYRLIRRVVSPQLLVTGAAQIFNRYYERGTMRVEAQRRGHARVQFRECYGFDRFIWEDLFGGCEGALEAFRAREIRIRSLEGGRDGDSYATILADWRE